MQPLRSTTVIWEPAKKVLFRIFFVYFVIYCLPFPLDVFEYTKPVSDPYFNTLNGIISFLGEKVYHIHAEPAFPGFDKVDDSGYGLVFLFTNIVLSLLIAWLWGFLDRGRANYEKAYQWFKLYLAYYLAVILFSYGFIKVFPSQFQEISASRLAMRVGDESPMLLAWNFMGYSTVMMRVTGVAEVIAALFLLFRKTTTLGALISIALMSFVTLMDYCFNVPIRLYSSHLLLMSVFLILEDRERLMNVFLFDRPTSSSYDEPMISQPTVQLIFSILLGIFALGAISKFAAGAIETADTIGQSAPRGPLYGVYLTTSFSRNGDTIPPLGTDKLRWKQLVIDGGAWQQSGVIYLNTDESIACNVEVDTLQHMLNLRSRADTAEHYELQYIVPDGRHLIVEGLWKDDCITVELEKYDLDNYRLHREGFKWIGD